MSSILTLKTPDGYTLSVVRPARSPTVRECVEALKPRLPRGTDLDALATYVLAVMEGGVMLSRSYGSVEPFDRTITQLRQHFQLLLAPKRTKAKAAKKPRKTSAVAGPVKRPKR